MLKLTLLTTLGSLCALSQGAPAQYPSLTQSLAQFFGMAANNGASKAPGTPAGFKKQVFLDDFESGSLDTGKWKYDLGTQYPGGAAQWGTGEKQTYTKDAANIGVSGGVLRITPTKSGDGAWKSARIETAAGHDVQCKKGGKLRVEARIKVGTAGPDPAKQSGIWPAFWMLGAEFRGDYQNWPAIGEVDILETANGEAKVHHTVHCGTAPGGPCGESNGVGAAHAMTRGAFHTLAVEIDRSPADRAKQTLKFFLDGKLDFTVTPAQVQNDQAAWDALAGNSKMILLNVAVGGGFPDGIGGGITTPNGATVGGKDVDMEVDYVAAWST